LKKSVSESELISESESESSSYLSGENFDRLVIHRGFLDVDDWVTWGGDSSLGREHGWIAVFDGIKISVEGVVERGETLIDEEERIDNEGEISLSKDELWIGTETGIEIGFEVKWIGGSGSLIVPSSMISKCLKEHLLTLSRSLFYILVC